MQRSHGMRIYLPLFPKLGVSPPELEALEQQTDLFDRTVWYHYVPKNLNLIVAESGAVEIQRTFISSILLPLLGVTPALGLAFSETEPSQSVLLNHELWKQRFGS